MYPKIHFRIQTPFYENNREVLNQTIDGSDCIEYYTQMIHMEEILKMKSVARLVHMSATVEDKWRKKGINLPPISILHDRKCLHISLGTQTV